jgi:hypothetical protein
MDMAEPGLYTKVGEAVQGHDAIMKTCDKAKHGVERQ